MSEEWKKFNEEVKQAIEKPTKKDLLKMNDDHLAIYELNQEKVALEQSLKEVNEKLERYYEKIAKLLNSKNPPDWAWKWKYKKTNIQWKQEFINRLGKAEANKILSITPQKEYEKIGVRFVDPHPDHIPENPIEKSKKDIKRLDLPAPKLSLAEKLAQMKG